MFTGIVEEIGTIRKIDKGVSSCSITVQAGKVLQGSQVGDSIAVNGVYASLQPAYLAISLLRTLCRRR